jgi:hypothetical protein
LAAPPAVPVKKARGKKKQTKIKQEKRPALSLLDWMKNRQPADNH